LVERPVYPEIVADGRRYLIAVGHEESVADD
jgi:hypothetical protein